MNLMRLRSGLVIEIDHEDLPLPDWWDDPAVKRSLERGYGHAPFTVERFVTSGGDPRTPGRRYWHRGPQIMIIVTAGRWENDGNWLHASISHPDKVPTYDELQIMSRAVFGDRFAYQVFAPAASHVNEHPYCLHLWGRLDDDAPQLPDFGKWGRI